MKHFLNKRNTKIIVICIIVFMLFNLLGGFIIGFAGQTRLDIFLGFLSYAIWGVVFAIILIFVDWMMGRRKK